MTRANVRLTERDLKVIEWLKMVRIADMEGVRAGLEAYSGEQKQSLRLAYRWVERMKLAGLVKAETPFYGAGQICWVTSLGGGARKKPNLLSQVARHDIQVARISALWVGLGWAWEADSREGHRADGLAVSPGKRVAVEVELSVKESQRLRGILYSYWNRVDTGEIAEIWYYCTPAVAAALHKTIEDMTKNHGVFFGHSLHISEYFDVLGKPRERVSNEESQEK